MVKDFYNLDIYYIIELFSILHNAHVIPKTKNKLYFISIIILVGITLTNYISLIGKKSVYKCNYNCSKTLIGIEKNNQFKKKRLDKSKK